MSRSKINPSKFSHCPLCGRIFDVKAAWKHINEFHPGASERELILIRDVKREKIPFSTKPLNKDKNIMVSSPYRPDGNWCSGGIPSLGKKR